MFAAIKRMPRALLVSILLHLLLLAVILISFNWARTPESQPSASGEPEPIQATMVDASTIESEMNKLKQAEEQREKAEQKRQADLERKQQDAQRKADEAERRQQEAQRKAEAAEQRAQQQEAEIALRKQEEAKKREEEQKKAEAEAKAKAAVDVKKAEDAKRKAEQDAKKAAEDAKAADLKKQADAEAKKAADAKAKADAEAALKAKQAAEAAAKQKADAEQRRKAELAAQLAAEENAAANAANARRLKGLNDQYIAAIRAKVERNWLKPSTATPGMTCKVRVTQMPGGMVMEVKLLNCSGDELFKRSVISAVEKSSPLPAPPDPSLFDRELEFDFKPE